METLRWRAECLKAVAQSPSGHLDAAKTAELLTASDALSAWAKSNGGGSGTDGVSAGPGESGASRAELVAQMVEVGLQVRVSRVFHPVYLSSSLWSATK